MPPAGRRCKGPVCWIYPHIGVLAGHSDRRRTGDAPMAQAKPSSEKDYDDIPGTYVFDADRSRQGYHLNMFCMSLMKAENRKAFKDDEPKYLDARFPQLT